MLWSKVPCVLGSVVEHTCLVCKHSAMDRDCFFTAHLYVLCFHSEDDGFQVIVKSTSQKVVSSHNVAHDEKSLGCIH